MATGLFMLWCLRDSESHVGPKRDRSGVPQDSIERHVATGSGVNEVESGARLAPKGIDVHAVGVGGTSIVFRPTAGASCSVEFVAKGAARSVIAKLDAGNGEFVVISWNATATSDYVLYVSSPGFVQRAVVLRSLPPDSHRDLGVIALDARRRLLVHLHSGADLSGVKATLDPIEGGGGRLEAEIKGQLATFDGVAIGRWRFGIIGLSAGVQPDVVSVEGGEADTHAAVAVITARATFTGRVTLESGLAVAGVTVRCGAVNQKVVTDQLGMFQFDAWASERIALVVWDENARIEDVAVGPFDPEQWMSGRIEVSARSTYSIDLADGEFVREVRVVPVNRSVSGRPIICVPRVAEGGRFVCAGLRKGVNVLLCRYKDPFFQYGAPQVVEAGGISNLRVEPHGCAAATLRCDIRGVSGEIIPGASLSLVAWVDLGDGRSRVGAAVPIDSLQALRSSSWCTIYQKLADQSGSVVTGVPLSYSDDWGVVASASGYRDRLITANEWTGANSEFHLQLVLKPR